MARKLRRLFPKRMSATYINVHQGPNQTWMGILKGSVQSVKGPRWNSEPVLKNTFTREVPRTKGKTMPEGDDGFTWDKSQELVQPVPRQQVENKLREIKSTKELWQGIRRQGLDTFHSVTLLKVPGLEVKMFFSGNRFFFTRQQGNAIEKSVVYPGRELAMQAWDNGRVWWREMFVVSD